MQRNYRLDDVDEQFVKGSLKLHEISDDKKVKSLQSLSKNWELVMWIQKSYKSKQMAIISN